MKANVVSMMRMSRIVIPAMVKRGKGVVINIGSASSIIPSPLLCVYGATKVCGFRNSQVTITSTIFVIRQIKVITTSCN